MLNRMANDSGVIKFKKIKSSSYFGLRLGQKLMHYNTSSFDEVKASFLPVI